MSNLRNSTLILNVGPDLILFTISIKIVKHFYLYKRRNPTCGVACCQLMKTKINIFWFRRDLRLTDNAGLFHALSQPEKVLPIFIFDTNILSELPRDDARITFIHSLLSELNAELTTFNSSLAVFYGNPEDIFKMLTERHAIRLVAANGDYEPYARNRDRAVFKLLDDRNIAFETFKDQVVFEKNEIAKPDGKPYVVFTPFSNRWLQRFAKERLTFYPSEEKLTNVLRHEYPFLQLDSIGFAKSKIAVADASLSVGAIAGYEKTRNFPALDKTTRLGPHLRFGSVSVRKVVAIAAKSNDLSFLKELIWREFFMQILWHFPDTVLKNFRPKYDRIDWRNNQREFGLWCEGKTGYPLVDAGMRELKATGFMHNRVRMVAAGFLCKHLLIDWRWGEAYFAEKLLDYEQASNVGNWQWAAGSGVDAAPYFRIFNPDEQRRKFDKDFEYVKKWVPEFATVDYPDPIVEHKFARERCLNVYRQVLV